MSDYEMFDKLVREIEAAEAELARIQATSSKGAGAGGGVKAEAAELREEEAILRAEPLSGLVEDEQSRYYIAVGCIEKQLEDLRQRSILNVKAEANCAQDLGKIRDEIAKQKKIVSDLEMELGQTNTKDDVNSGKRKEFQMQSRHNSMVLKSLKGELRDFLNDRAKLNPDYQEDQGSCFGYLLQTLWTNYLQHGHAEYVSIQDLEFDVEEGDLQHLVSAGIVTQHKNDKDLIKLVDFTMST